MERLFRKQSVFDFLSTSKSKRILVLVILCCMVINGFVPRSVESKNSLFIIMTAVVGSAVVDLVEGCRDTLTVISNKVTESLLEFLSLQEVATKAPKQKSDSKEPMPVNTTSDNGIMVQKKEYQELVELSIKGEMISADTIIVEKLYRLYENIKVSCSQIEGLTLLFFIMFVGAIRRRKEISETIILSGISKYKTDLC